MRFRFTLNNTTKGRYVLPTDPKGWESAEVNLKRGLKYHGIVMEYSIKLDFHYAAGKDYIDDVFNTQGEDAEVTILIEIECNGAWETFFNGLLDLSTYETSGEAGQRESFTSVNIIDSNVTKVLLNRISTKVDLSTLQTLNGTALTTFTKGPYDLNLHSKVIRYSSLFQENGGFTNPYTRNYTVNQNTTVAGSAYYNVPFSIIYSEFADYNENTEPLYTSEQNFFVADTTDDLLIEYSIDMSFAEGVDSLPRGYDYALVIEIGGTQRVISNGGSWLTIPSTTGPINASFNVSGSFTQSGVSIGEGVSCSLQIRDLTVGSGPPATSDATVTVTWGSGDYVKVSKNSTTAASTCKAFAVHEAGARIAQVITDQTDAFRSNFFGRTDSQPNTYASNGCGAPLALTNGALIRKFPIEEKPMFLSMEDYYEGLNAIFNLGIGVEEGGSGYVIRMEEKEYFYDTTVVIRIPNIPKMTMSFSKEFVYTEADIGFTKWETEEINGIDEFNTKRQYSFGVKSSNQKLTALSKFIGSGYSLEFIRRKQYIDFPTTDTKYDNDIFSICLNRSDLTTAEKNENYTQVPNLISPETSYNLRISPARNLLRWANVLNAGMIKRPGEEIKFTYSEGNSMMSSEFTSDSCKGNYNNDLLTENQNLVWDSTSVNSPPIWVPLVYEFDYPLSFEQYKNLKTVGSDGKLNAYKCIEISRSNSDFVKTYVLDIEYRPTTGMATFKLLRANA